MAKITYLSLKPEVPPTGYWDHAFVRDMLSDLGDSDRHIFVIPGKEQWDVIDKINVELNKFKKILVIVTSDEECNFNVNKLEHPDMIIYSQYGNGGYMFPLGYTTGTKELLKKIGLVDKDISCFFAGQNTHIRRHMLIEQLEKVKDVEMVTSQGFAQGLDREQYFEKMARAKTVPCPSGAVSEDSFRLYEALEAGAVPIADLISPLRSYSINYWNKMFGVAGFPTYADVTEVPKLIWQATHLDGYNNWVYAWWINKKYQFREALRKHLDIAKPEMVVVIPVSPIPSHPDTAILEETIKSVRVQLPEVPIVVTFDGVRPEQEDKRGDYQEFIRRMLWKMNFEYKDVLPVIFNKHQHQSGMMRTFLKQSDIPLILYVEQDTPLTPDRPIDWEKCKDYIRSGKANVVRFHFEEHIPKPHEYLMVGEVEDGMQRTVQWSQRPHLASKEMYKIIMGLFTEDANCFIEDYIHGQLQNIWNEKGIAGWDMWKVWIYHPEGGIKRSYHTDGRNGDTKFVEEQKW